MKKEVEFRIQRSALLLYGIIAVAAIGMILYIYYLRNNVYAQKENIEYQNLLFAKTNELIYSVQQAQSLTHSFISSRDKSYFEEHRLVSDYIEHLIDTLNYLAGSTPQTESLSDIALLLEQDRIIVEELNKQFLYYNPLDSIFEQIEDYTLSKKEDSLIMVLATQDTTYTMLYKKTFWQRLGELFAPKKYEDTVISQIIFRTDTLKIPVQENETLMADVQYLSKQGRENYAKQMGQIKRQVEELVVLEQSIAKEISSLLIRFHEMTLDSIMRAIKKSEEHIQKNYFLLLIGGVLLLGLVLALIILIIRNANKGYVARKELERINQMTKTLMEERHSLFLSVSHDIKAPLTSILGYLELWQNDELFSSKFKELSSMRSSGRYILALLENLLGYSSMERGTLELSISRFNLRELCVEISDMISPLVAYKNLRFECEFNISSDLCILSDRVRLKQIIINLLTNSVKYTFSGFLRFQVDYIAGTVHILVEDSGIGIPPEKMEEIFEPFVRVGEAKPYANGSGFGLYLVKGLVEMFGGNLKFISEEQKGTQVLVKIPVSEDEEENGTLPEDKKGVPLLVKEKANLLLVDDDTILLSLLQEFFLSLHYSVTLCTTLEGVEKALHSFPTYDMVLTDMEMGLFSGKDVLRKVESIGLTVPVVVMTARDDYNLEKSQSEGFAGCIKKPFSIAELSQLFAMGSTSNLYDHSNVTGCEFRQLYEMLDGDMDAVRHILDVFVESTEEKLYQLKKALWMDNFEKARFLSHQMLSSFGQLGITEELAPLKKMDLHREIYMPFPTWKIELEQFLLYAEKLLATIREFYLSER